MKTKYFIDFDDTLFDRKKFSRDLFDIMRWQGFSDEEIETSYREVYHAGYDGIWAHLQHLFDAYRPFDVEKAREEVGELFSKGLDYLFPEAVDFVKNIDRSRYEVFMLTVGAPEFQAAKVEGSSINRYFENPVIYTTKTKAEKLTELVTASEKFIMLDDKDRELQAITLKFPLAITLKAEGGDLLQYCDPLAMQETSKIFATSDDLALLN